MSPAVFEIAF